MPPLLALMLGVEPPESQRPARDGVAKPPGALTAYAKALVQGRGGAA